MRCPNCRSTAVQERPERTAQGYRRFRCLDCTKQFNERSSGLLNRTQYPSDVIALVVLWRLRYKLSLRDLAEMFLIRGFVFSYEAVRDWEAKLTPALAEELRRSRKGKVGRSWYTDETYIRVHGRWKYLYRAIDRDGALVDVMLSEHRNLAAAKRFFRSAKAVTGVIPDRVTTDGHDAYPRAIRLELGSCVWHRTNCLPQQSPRAGSSRHQGPMSTDARLQERPISQTILPRLRRTQELPALSFSHVPTRSRRYAALSLHAPDSHRSRYAGSCLSGGSAAREFVARNRLES